MKHFAKQLKQPRYKREYWNRAKSIFQNDLKAAAPSLNYIYDIFNQYELSLKKDYLVSSEFPIMAKEFIKDKDIVINDEWRKARDTGVRLGAVFKRCNFIAKHLPYFGDHGRMLFGSIIDDSNKIIVKDEKAYQKLDSTLAMVKPRNKSFMEVRRNIEIDPSKF